MANDRRRGIGFGDGSRVEGGRGDFDDVFDDEVEATRAMDMVDDLDMPTAMPQHAPPPPSRPAPRPRPAAAPPRPAPPAPGPPATLHDPDAFHGAGGGNEDATRMLDADALADMGIAPPPAQQGTPMELRVVSGPDRGKVHHIEDGDFLVGRGLDCHIVLADPAVSRKHFRIVRRGEICEAVDMGGANGTNINGQRASRHALQPGDQIEVGTTVLEFFIQGVVPERARDFPMPEAPSHRSPAIAANAKKSNTGLIIAAAVAGVLVLGGGAVAAWLVMSGADEPAAAATDEKPAADLTKMIDRAKGMLEDRDWAAAVDQLKEARELAPDDAEVKGLLAKAHDEVEAEEVIAEGKELARKGMFKEALGRFKEVPQTSEQYADAREELNATREDFFRERLGAAKKAWSAGDKDAAGKAVDEVLALDEKNAEARLLKEQIASGAAPEPEEAKDEGKDDKGSAKADEKDDDKGSSKGGGASGNAKALMSQGLRAYHNKEWSAAEAAFSQVASGGFSRKDKSKATEFLEAVKDVGKSTQDAGSASSPIKAARAWQKAYKADRRVDGHHGPWLVKQLTKAWVSAAEQLFKARRYPEAAEAAREAMNFDPENAKAMDIDDKCREAAKGMLKKAEEHLQQKNYATARDMARKVMQILGMMDPASQKAREIAIKAQEASSGGDED